jgi:hypothetical protein
LIVTLVLNCWACVLKVKKVAISKKRKAFISYNLRLR